MKLLQYYYYLPNLYSRYVSCLAHFNQWIERMHAGVPCLDAFIMSGTYIKFLKTFYSYQLLNFI